MLNLEFKTSPPLKLAAATLLAIALTGCGGGGGSSNVKPNIASPTASGAGPTGSATVGTAPTPAAVVASANAGSPLVAGTAPAVSQTQINNGATAGTQGVAGMSVSAPGFFNNVNKGTVGAVTFDPSFTLNTAGSISVGTVTSLTINSANATTTGTSLAIAKDATHSVFSNSISSIGFLNTFTASNGQYIGVAQATGYSYTQYGDWYECSSNCANSGITTEVNGFFVRGEATAPANIPTTGSYTYTGLANGVGVDAAGYSTNGTADMMATANFVARSIAFSTTNTKLTPVGGGNTVAYSSLDMSGTLTYVAGQNLFAGTVATAGTGQNSMSGTVAGRFYGPKAEEIGGLFALSGAGGGFVGGFIGK